MHLTPSSSIGLSNTNARDANVDDSREALIVGGTTAVVVFLGVAALGYQVRVSTQFLFGSIAPVIRLLALTGMVTGLTVLAFTHALLSATRSPGIRIGKPTFRQMRQISIVCGIMVVASLALLLVPGMSSFDNLPKAAYYAFIAHAAILIGLLVATLVLLNLTLTRMASNFEPAGSASRKATGAANRFRETGRIQSDW